MATETALE